MHDYADRYEFPQYHIFVAGAGNRARVHEAACRHYVHRRRGYDRWYGPYDRLAEAETAMRRLGIPDVGTCMCCEAAPRGDGGGGDREVGDAVAVGVEARAGATPATPSKSVAPTASAHYFIYEFDPTERARLHAGTCRHYLDRKRVEHDSYRWHGPFATLDDADDTLQALGKKNVGWCLQCLPRAKRAAEPRPSRKRSTSRRASNEVAVSSRTVAPQKSSRKPAAKRTRTRTQYYIYDDTVTNRARMHRATCGSFTRRKTKMRSNNRWLGPFDTQAQANAAMRDLPRRDKRKCRTCFKR